MYPLPVTTLTLVTLLTASVNVPACVYKNGVDGRPDIIGVVRAFEPSPDKSVVPCTTDSPTLFSVTFDPSTSVNCPLPIDVARYRAPFHPLPLLLLANAPLTMMLELSCPLKSPLVDSISKNINVVVGSAGLSPAPAPPLISVAVMVNSQVRLALDTGDTPSTVMKWYSPKFTFSRKSTSCALMAPLPSVSRFAN